MLTRTSCLYRFSSVVLKVLLLAFVCGTAAHSFAASANNSKPLAATPPMGWNDWGHYQCEVTAQDMLDNAKALVKTGLAARGYNTVVIDDCWMQKDRDAHGNLQADLKRFPQGIKPVADAVHALGLKFGIYEAAGYETCSELAGSGEPNGGGKDHFLQDARLFASWGVDFLKLDGCLFYVPPGVSKVDAYRKAYAAASVALKAVGRPVVFLESAPAYFMEELATGGDTPYWYDVLSWVDNYGQLWRTGDDMAGFHADKPNAHHFHSVLWNYAYNRPLGRFQKPGNWNDPDFIIGGDVGMTLAETRSQLALWSMMSSPLILGAGLVQISPQAVAILGNKAVIAVDQDPLGRMATLIRRGPAMDVLFKPLSGGSYAVAVLNRSAAAIQADLHPADLGFASNTGCHLNAQNLWSQTHSSAVSTLQASIAAHDTAIWRIRPAPGCGKPARTGAITMIAPGKRPQSIEGYNVCLAASGRVEACAGTPAETWTVTGNGALKSGGRCLAATDGHLAMQPCTASKAQHWNYLLVGQLVDAKGRCLTASGPDGKPQSLSMEACGHNPRNQIWSLPN